MRMFTLSGNSAAASVTGLGSNVTGAAFTLTANSAADSLAHKITVHNDAATDHSGKTIALVGTDANGKVLTETLTGPAGTATVTSTNYFLTLTSATPSATIGADTFDIGWAAASVSPSFNPSLSGPYEFNVGFGCTVVAGSPTFTVQHSYDGALWVNHSTVAAKTSNIDGAYTNPVRAIRLSWTVAGNVSMSGIQHGA